MKIFLAGDYYSETGPANATKTLLQAMPSDTRYQKVRNKILRVPELIWKTLRTDAVVYSGTSRQVILGIRIAHFFHKKTFYIMHGSIAHEGGINHDYNKKLFDTEKYILEYIDYILAVSVPFEKWLKASYPAYAHKIYHLINAVDWNLIPITRSDHMRIPDQIMSVGGGMPRKNILTICKAIEKLYPDQNACPIRLIVAGAEGEDTVAIKSYHFVDDIGLVTHSELLSHMQKSTLYIQNSVFETFGIAPLEALLCGCSLLLSSYTGALSIIPGACSDEIINNPYDIDELASKIQKLLQSNNHDRLLASIDFESSSPRRRAQELIEIIETLINL